jgi:hypothetical protein
VFDETKHLYKKLHYDVWKRIFVTTSSNQFNSLNIMENKYIKANLNDAGNQLVVLFPTNRVSISIDLKVENEEDLTEMRSSLEKVRNGLAQFIANMSSNESVELFDMGDIAKLKFVQKTEWTSGSVSISLTTASDHGAVTITLPNSSDLLEEIVQVSTLLKTLHERIASL